MDLKQSYLVVLKNILVLVCIVIIAWNTKNALVMIDEPELSLHVSWQDSFVDDLKEIISIAQFDVILATHSPYIIGDHSNLMVALSAKQPKVIN